MIFRSLRANLNSGLLLTILLLAVALWGLFGIAVERIIHEYIQTRLEHDAETILVAMHFDKEDNLRLDEQKIQNIYHRPFSGHYFVIRYGELTLRSRSLWDESLPPGDNIPSGMIAAKPVPGPEQQQLLVRREEYRKQGNTFTIFTAEDVSHVDEQIYHFQKRFGLVLVLIIVVLLVAQTLIIYFGMRPVREAARSIKKLETGDETQLPENVPAEVLPLVREVNRLLDHQQQRLVRSRNAMGDLSHAIKTPLSLILQWYESLDEKDQQQHASVRESIMQISRRVDSELKRARMAGDQRGGQRFSLDLDLPALLDTLRRLYQDSDIQLQLHEETGPLLPLEREDGVELLGNLLDNAWKWADTVIQLRISSADGQLRISIEDDGPGIEAPQAEQLLQRGKRREESVTGHGIGLSIVRQIVDSYQGSLHLQRSQQLGGLQVIVQLPFNPTQAD